jgi:hypothetical protein
MPGRPARKLRIRWASAALLCSALVLVMCGIVLSAAAGGATSGTNRSAAYPPASACATQSKTHVAGQHGTPFSRCVAATAHTHHH